MPPLISHLLPDLANSDKPVKSGSAERHQLSLLLKLSNDQLLSLISNYSQSNSNQSPSVKLIVKNNRVDGIKLDDKTYKLTNSNESAINLYASLDHDSHAKQEDKQENKCASLGPLNYRANILNFKPSPISTADNEVIRNFHLKVQVLEYLSQNSIIEVDLDSLRRHFNKVPLTEMKRIYDDITIQRTKKLNMESLLLLRNSTPLTEFNEYLDKLGYSNSDPLRLMISNDTSKLKLDSKVRLLSRGRGQ
ncbi:unnamed protein product [Ambrosiozyma monospora]|uniref:Unnamed protein product n=1 Tax=Ambrosiozyma monospora TaxID=43982 RepID=A0ACB5TS81_AMBMO|nr:unnamed protein product [Ambrosiozyma monospora]